MSLVTHALMAAILWPLVHGMSATVDTTGHTAVIPPFHDRENSSGIEGPVRLSRLSFTLLVYRDAVAVYEEADLVNTGREPVVRELSLPSTGFDQNGPEPGGAVSDGLLGVRLWVDGERAIPQMISDGDDVSWYTIRAAFRGFDTRRVKAMFWARTFPAGANELPGLDSTYIARGPRHFMLDLSHAALWNGPIGTVDVTALLEEGMDMENAAIHATPDSYEGYGTVLRWHQSEVDPTADDDISVTYLPDDTHRRMTTLAEIARSIAKEGYDELLRTVDSMRE